MAENLGRVGCRRVLRLRDVPDAEHSCISRSYSARWWSVAACSSESVSAAPRTRPTHPLARVGRSCATHRTTTIATTRFMNCSESIVNKGNAMKERNELKSCDGCDALGVDTANDEAQHAKAVLQAAGRDHDRQPELEVKNIATSLYTPTTLHRLLLSHSRPNIACSITPLNFHCHLAGNDSPVAVRLGAPTSSNTSPQNIALTNFLKVMPMPYCCNRRSNMVAPKPPSLPST
jgi:hypothetical protein